MTALLESPGPVPPLSEERERRRRRRTFWTVVAFSLGFHALLALLAGAWIITRAWHRPVVVFSAHRAAAPLPAEDDDGGGGSGTGATAASSYVPPPPASETVAGTLPLALPDLALPSATLDPSPPAPLSLAGGGSGTASLSASAGSGTGNGGDGLGNGLSFFGLQEQARRVVIALDVSTSMFVRAPGAFDKISGPTPRSISWPSRTARWRGNRRWSPPATPTGPKPKNGSP